MGERAFFEATAKEQAKATIQAIEAQTSAEVVVSLRHVSGSYRAADWLAGAALALVSLVALLYVPWTFALHFILVDVVLAFAIGALASATIAPLRRALTSKKVRDANVHAAARAAFVDLGVSRTSGRWGVLVYVAMFEREVEVVADVAIDAKKTPGFDEVVAKLRAAIVEPDLPRFLDALRGLGPVLGAAFPHREGDVNELADEVDDAPAER
jgi:putative membrane protein